jgi:hypothetical protein
VGNDPRENPVYTGIQERNKAALTLINRFVDSSPRVLSLLEKVFAHPKTICKSTPEGIARTWCRVVHAPTVPLVAQIETLERMVSCLNDPEGKPLYLAHWMDNWLRGWVNSAENSINARMVGKAHQAEEKASLQGDDNPLWQRYCHWANGEAERLLFEKYSLEEVNSQVEEAVLKIKGFRPENQPQVPDLKVHCLETIFRRFRNQVATFDEWKKSSCNATFAKRKAAKRIAS